MGVKDQVIETLGISTSEFERAAADRRRGTPDDGLAAETRNAANVSMRSGRGRRAIDLVADKMREAGEIPSSSRDKSRPVMAYVADAVKMLEAFLADPASEDSFMYIARAGVLLEEAIENEESGGAPAFANLPPELTAAHRAVDREIERQIGPLLTSARELRREIRADRVTDEQCAVARQLGIAVEDLVR